MRGALLRYFKEKKQGLDLLYIVHIFHFVSAPGQLLPGRFLPLGERIQLHMRGALLLDPPAHPKPHSEE